MDTKKIINSMIDAVVASQKKFVEIPQNVIFSFFDKEGVPRNMWNNLYDQLKQKFEPVKEDRKHLSSIVDYSDSSHNQVKVRQPRKSVFSEITKIAG
jgi:predicted solute-binding protein